jgi:hypothetical protein
MMKICLFLAKIFTTKFGLRTSVVKSGHPNQWKLNIWKESMSLLKTLLSPYFTPDMKYKIND